LTPAGEKLLNYTAAEDKMSDAESTTHSLTQLLRQAGQGNRDAENQFIQLIYADLHRRASRCMMGEAEGHLLQTTALVNEAYMRLFAGQSPLQANDRNHFFKIAARQMRNILIDHARGEKGPKRGGAKVSLDEALVVSPEKRQDLIALDDALRELQEVDPEAAQVVELRFFGGYTDQETSEIMGQSYAKVRRDWEFARAWLYDRLAQA
jgi:RNA polymerase sigma-70 factor (ECF subfamily)